MKEDLSGLVASGRMAVRRLRFVFLPPTGLYLSAQGNTLGTAEHIEYPKPITRDGYPELIKYTPVGDGGHNDRHSRRTTHSGSRNIKQKVALLEGQDQQRIPTYQYHKTRDRDLTALFDIERNVERERFASWFTSPVKVDAATEAFLAELIEENTLLIDSYGEEDLKIKFIGPLLKQVRFTSYEKRVRDFYEVSMTYATDRFILKGTVDFMVAEGLVDSKTPYFFIQEFKRSEEYGNPRPQLLAELISALELNQWTEIKGAYVIGGNWRFVILEKLAQDTYQYFLSQNFDATKLDDLTEVYKHLVCVKQEILARIDATR